MKIKALFSVLLLAFSTISTANVMMEMFQMQREMGTLLRAESAEKFQQGAENFLVAAKKAQQTMPMSLDEDQEKFKGYQAGMQDVIDVVEQAKELAAAGKLDEAKTTVSKLNKMKASYHAEYK
ncbi:cytochrome b562 [Frederiksenia canicola]|uniref:Cytochrome B562 n=1 Tax=Frederiksenia canicola TaxID=123824 RepID=A0AAE7C1X1_9PAST|nr:cytochrome b562 [Frederiksenia canicola]QIM64038.1 cytochrome B562 [Frederiksenia canicola]RPE95637.1 soluble cytochrome b562 [Frederiksenia canicola]